MNPTSRNFALIIVTNTLSRIANLVLFLALPILTLSLTGSPAWAGIVAFVNGGTAVIGSLIGGVVIDRRGAKEIAVIADIASLVSVGMLAGIVSLGLPMWLFLIAVAAGSILDGAGATARYTLFPHIARKTKFSMEQATSISQTIEGISEIVGPILGGVLIGLLGGVWTLLITAGLFGLALIPLLVIPRVPSEYKGDTHPAEDFIEGFQVIWNDNLLRPFTLFSTAVLFFLMPFWAVLLPVYFGGEAGAVELGTFNSVYGGFALLGAAGYGLIAGKLSKFQTINWINWLSVPFYMIPAFVMSDSWLVWIFAGFLGLSVGPIMPIISTVYYQRTPDKLLGRVNGTSEAMAAGAGPLGGIIFGLIIEYGSFDMAYWVFILGNFCIAIWFLLVPGLRLMDTPVMQNQSNEKV